jgi:hypothetical protein
MFLYFNNLNPKPLPYGPKLLSSINGVITETIIAPSQLAEILRLAPESGHISATYRKLTGAIEVSNEN